MVNDFKRAFVSPAQTLAEVLENMNQTGYKTVLVVDESGKLQGIATDWDVRTTLLSGTPLSAEVSQFMNRRPVLGTPEMSPVELRDIMVKQGNDCIPVVDENQHVMDFMMLRDFVQRDNLLSPVVIMAGGAGKRLWPLTEDTPKPLLHVADRPVLEHILNHVKSQGLEQVWVSTYYKSEKIEHFLDENTPDDIQVTLIKEENPLGTAGSLKALQRDDGDKPIFILNGDTLTDLNFQEMMDWHCSHENVLTMCTTHYQIQVPYGVVETQGQEITRIQEKPMICYNINAGIYLLERAALSYIPDNVHFDMTDLIDSLLSANQRVGAFPIVKPWIDIGQPADYTKANQQSQQYLSVGA